jgi:hypothetical protein
MLQKFDDFSFLALKFGKLRPFFSQVFLSMCQNHIFQVEKMKKILFFKIIHNPNYFMKMNRVH